MTSTPAIRLLCSPGLRGIRAGAPPGPLPDPLGRPGVEFYLRGSAALWRGLQLLPPGAGRSILFPSYHCGIELDVVAKAGLRAVFYPIGRELQLDVDDLRRCAGPDTRAVFVIHHFGFLQCLDAVRQLCDERDWVLIEDCAHALLAARGDRPAGTAGDLAVFSLHKSLPLPCGGALVVNRDTLARRFATVRPPLGYVASQVFDLAGRDLARSPFVNLGPVRRAKAAVSAKIRSALDRPDRSPDAVAAPGSLAFRKSWEGARLPAVSRWLLPRIRLDQVRERRRRNYTTLLHAVAGCRRIAPLIAELPAGACPVFFPVTVCADPAAFLQFCRSRGVGAHTHWRGMHPEFPAHRFPEAVWLKQQVIDLPVHQDLDERDLALLRDLIVAWERADR